jgi:hypothetical protein
VLRILCSLCTSASAQSYILRHFPGAESLQTYDLPSTKQGATLGWHSYRSFLLTVFRLFVYNSFNTGRLEPLPAYGQTTSCVASSVTCSRPQMASNRSAQTLC